MNNKVFISCAVTGSGDTASKHPDLPKTPEQIATASIEAAKAGAAIAHIHVREEDGTPSRRLELYKEVVDRVRSSGTDVILNLTTGMGGDLDIGQGDNPLDFGPMTDMANVMERIANAEQFLPEICTMDAGTLNFGDSSVITVNTPNDLRKAAKKLKEIGVKPEIEAFDLGNMWFGAQLYKEVVDRVRSSGTDVILNLTTGMGGDLDIGQGDNPLDFGPMTDMANVMERIANAEQFLPEICTLDAGTLNFGDSSVITVNTPNDLRKAAKKLKEIGVKPEIEAFDLGNMWFGAQLYKEGLLSDPPMFQMCLGIPWGAPATTLAMQAMKDIMPKEGVWSGFAISKNEMPFVAQTILMGGNPRVGLEDNLYLSKGKLATNAQLVEKAIRIADEIGYSPMTPAETREKLKLVKHK